MGDSFISPSLPFLSLSLSHIHTHTQTHTPLSLHLQSQKHRGSSSITYDLVSLECTRPPRLQCHIVSSEHLWTLKKNNSEASGPPPVLTSWMLKDAKTVRMRISSQHLSAVPSLQDSGSHIPKQPALWAWDTNRHRLKTPPQGHLGAQLWVEATYCCLKRYIQKKAEPPWWLAPPLHHPSPPSSLQMSNKKAREDKIILFSWTHKLTKWQ